MNDVPDIWAAAKMAFEGRGAHGGWVGEGVSWHSASSTFPLY